MAYSPCIIGAPSLFRKMETRPWIQEGDWFITKSSTQTRHGTPRPQCFEYLYKPKDGWDMPPKSFTVRMGPLPPSTYIGPVHGQPENFNGYCTVRVPSFYPLPGQRSRLVWVNISKDNISFANKVSDTTVQSWKQSGWTNNIYLDPDR